MTYSEASWYAEKAKKMPRNTAENMQRILLMRANETHVVSQEVLDVIYSISERFVEQDRQMRREIMEEEMRRNGTLSQESIEADDDQIIQAIKKTLEKFKSDRDWGGIYRILVDYCDFPSTKTDFVKRFARMGIYPKDNFVKDLEHSLPPSIRATEWYDHPFSYQAIQKGINTEWPQTYAGWKNYETDNRDFKDRLAIAKTFLSYLMKATKEL